MHARANVRMDVKRNALQVLLAALAIAAPAHAQTSDPTGTFTEKAGQLAEDRAAAQQAVAAYKGTWTHRALTLQYALGNDVPFANAPWIGTHNSFNTTAYGFTLSRSDSNQQLTLTEQLELDVRSLELDVHWVEGEPKVCHGTEQHAGCSSEGPLGPLLDEISAFLDRPENRDQILLLYLEDQIKNAEGYDVVAAELERAFGTKLFRSAGGACSPKLPLAGVDRKAVLRDGAQVITVASGCGGGTQAGGATSWSRLVFDWSGDVHSESRPRGYEDFPKCGPDYDRAKYQSQIVRYFEDSTFVTSSTSTAGAAGKDDGITPETAAAMARCGVDLFGLDQLHPDDGRLERLVWSWGKDEPRPGRKCAVQRRSNARWASRRCAGKRQVACRRSDGRWLVPKKPVKRSKAGRVCRKRRARFAVPRTGYENQLLRHAASTPRTGKATWLGYRLKRGTWRATAAR